MHQPRLLAMIDNAIQMSGAGKGAPKRPNHTIPIGAITQGLSKACGPMDASGVPRPNRRPGFPARINRANESSPSRTFARPPHPHLARREYTPGNHGKPTANTSQPTPTKPSAPSSAPASKSPQYVARAPTLTPKNKKTFRNPRPKTHIFPARCANVVPNAHRRQ